MQSYLKQPFSNVQLELLKTFSHQLSDNDLAELRQTLAFFFAKRLIKQADDKNWTKEDFDRMLHTKMRKSK